MKTTAYEIDLLDCKSVYPGSIPGVASSKTLENLSFSVWTNQTDAKRAPTRTHENGHSLFPIRPAKSPLRAESV